MEILCCEQRKKVSRDYKSSNFHSNSNPRSHIECAKLAFRNLQIILVWDRGDWIIRWILVKLVPFTHAQSVRVCPVVCGLLRISVTARNHLVVYNLINHTYTVQLVFSRYWKQQN